MISKYLRFGIAPVAMTMMTTIPALAHADAGKVAGFVYGFDHPMSGLDHILAMVMVGVLAWQLGGRALWLVPSTFVVAMALGGALGLLDVGVPVIEIGIALSVALLGVGVGLNIETPLVVAVGLAGSFAVFHGHAHGAEVPETVNGVTYATGFVLATVLLHLGGMGTGFLIGNAGEKYGPAVVRATGAATACVGVGFLAGVL